MNLKKENRLYTLVVLLLFLVILSFVCVSMVYGKYTYDMNDDVLLDVTAEGKLEITVTEKSDGVYTITNTDESNMPAYVRMSVFVGLQNSDGQLWASPTTEGVEYTLNAPNCTKLDDGYYYYCGMVPRNSGFDISVSPKTLPDGYTLQILVVAEGIQYLPGSAAEDAWGASYDSTNATWSEVAPD